MTKTITLLFFLSLLASFSASADVTDCNNGVKAHFQEEYPQAIKLLTTCLSQPLKPEPKSYTLKVRASAYFKSKQYILAAIDQKESIDFEEPKDVWPLLMLGMYFREAGDYSKSLEAINSAFEYDEDGPGTGPGMACYYHKGQTLHQAGRYKEAIESYTLGIPKQPDFGAALYKRALSYEILGNTKQAKRDFFRAYELEPKEGYEPEIASKLKEYGFNVKVKED